jgi:hypothetical protein
MQIQTIEDVNGNAYVLTKTKIRETYDSKRYLSLKYLRKHMPKPGHVFDTPVPALRSKDYGNAPTWFTLSKSGERVSIGCVRFGKAATAAIFAAAGIRIGRAKRKAKAKKH